MEENRNELFVTLMSIRDKIKTKIGEHAKMVQKDVESDDDLLQQLQKNIDNNVQISNKITSEMRTSDSDNPENLPFMRNLLNEQRTINKENQETDVVPKNKNTSSSEKEKTQAEKNEPPKVVSLLDKRKIKDLATELQKYVFGQDHVIGEVVDILKVAALKIKINKEKPAGNYLFAGPTGSGKTELSQTIAKTLGVPILIVNMGEYGLEQDVTKLIGTSPGYVGYHEGGILTNFVKENPACIIVFDELEKAHPSFNKILLSIMDKGVCTDNKGCEVTFKETIVISTSNLGADIEYLSDIDEKTKSEYKMQAIKEGISPEIINRYDSIFQFASLSPEVYKKVVLKFVGELQKSMKEEHNIDLKFSDKIVDFIVDKSYDPSMGGRPGRRFIEKVVIKPLADYMLDDNFESIVKSSHELTLDLNKDNNVCFKGKNRKILGVLENTKDLVDKIENNKFTKNKM